MAQPPTYTRQAAFTDYQTAHPSTPMSGSDLDNELNAVKATLDAILTNLAMLQRDDGALGNSTVTTDSLQAAALALLGSYANARGDWATATVYAVRDIVQSSGVVYMCVVAHTSGTFATDLAAGDWMSFMDDNPVFSGITTVDGVKTGLTVDASGAAIVIDFDGSVNHTIPLATSPTFSTTNRAAASGETKMADVRIVADAAGPYVMTFPAGWVWLGSKPASISASKTGILSLRCYGTAETDVVAVWGGQV